MMICSINDFEKVHSILSHESVYPYITDDSCPDKPDENLGRIFLDEPAVKVLMPNDNCLFILVPVTTNVYNVHTNILPDGRGKSGVLAGKHGAMWMFDNTDCTSIISFTPDFNRQALMYARFVGMKRIGVIRNSFKKDNVFYDQIITGLNKGEI